MCSGPPISLSTGEVLIEQGRPSQGIYLVLSGNLVVAREARGRSGSSMGSSVGRQSKLGSKSTEVKVLGEGSVLGEMSFLLNTPSLFTVRAAKSQSSRRSSLRVSSRTPSSDAGEETSFTGKLKSSTKERGHSSSFTTGSVLSEPSLSFARDASPHLSSHSVGAAVVAALDHETVRKLIATDPKLTQRLFHAMSCVSL